jgi:hypothetical protein|tara:strand:- start:164 stop:352 length:189 start_codon:yes stop_codon:yes gene_type:complete
MKEKSVTITSKNITSKQWAALVLELNLMRKAWTPYAKLELRGPGLKKIIAFGTRSGDAKQDR